VIFLSNARLGKFLIIGSLIAGIAIVVVSCIIKKPSNSNIVTAPKEIIEYPALELTINNTNLLFCGMYIVASDVYGNKIIYEPMNDLKKTVRADINNMIIVSYDNGRIININPNICDQPSKRITIEYCKTKYYDGIVFGKDKDINSLYSIATCVQLKDIYYEITQRYDKQEASVQFLDCITTLKLAIRSVIHMDGE